MRPLVPFAFVALVVVPTLACDDASAGASDGGTPTYLTLTGPAKRFCSGIWVSGRVREEALYNSVLWTDEQVGDYESPWMRRGRGRENALLKMRPWKLHPIPEVAKATVYIAYEGR